MKNATTVPVLNTAGAFKSVTTTLMNSGFLLRLLDAVPESTLTERVREFFLVCDFPVDPKFDGTRLSNAVKPLVRNKCEELELTRTVRPGETIGFLRLGMAVRLQFPHRFELGNLMSFFGAPKTRHRVRVIRRLH
jgi:hypothetical protein